MIFIAFGANLDSELGSPADTYEALPNLLAEEGIRVIAQSSLRETAPVPVSDQPNYFNALISVETKLNPFDLLAALLRVEESLGRKRTVKNAARTIDLDLIAYADEIFEAENLTLPHPRMHERDFVLVPLGEIAPYWVHPKLNRSVSDLLMCHYHVKQAA